MYCENVLLVQTLMGKYMRNYANLGENVRICLALCNKKEAEVATFSCMTLTSSKRLLVLM